MSGGHRRQHGADGGAGAVGGHEDRNLLIRQSALGRLAAPSASLAVEFSFAFTAHQDEGFVGLDDAVQFDRAGRRAAGSGDASGRPCCRPPAALRESFTVSPRSTRRRILSNSPCAAAANGVPVKALKFAAALQNIASAVGAAADHSSGRRAVRTASLCPILSSNRPITASSDGWPARSRAVSAAARRQIIDLVSHAR